MHHTAAFILGLFVTGGASAESTTQPYIAYVACPYAQVRCGPDIKHYATQQLKFGDEVEVYREDKGGWLAIRPPQGSFSLASAQHLEVTNDPALAKVVSAVSPAFVGTNLASVTDHRWQVQLRQGELVEVLGERVMAIHRGAQPATWIRISPPSGEFRWISAQDVSRERPEPGSGSHKPTPAPITLADLRIQPQTADASENSSIAPSVTAASGDEEFDAAPIPPTDPDDVELTDVEPSVIAPPQTDSQWSPKGIQPAETPLVNAAPLMLDHLNGFDEKLRTISLELSTMAMREPKDWNLAGLRTSAQYLQSEARMHSERQHAQRLVARITEFEQFQSRYLQWRQSSAPNPPPASDVLPASAAEAAPIDDRPSNPADAAALADPRFDGSGWLMPVHSTKRDAPPFALLDDDGVVLQYVTPAPGLNLRRYAKQEVGIVGQTSFLPALATPHLTAHRVVHLSRHQR